MSTRPDRTEKPKKRSDMACTNCRSRKLKCENTDSTPPCKRCEHDRVFCEFKPVSEDNSQSRGPQSRGSKTPSRDGSEDRKGNNQPVVSAFPKPVTPPTSSSESQTTNNCLVTPPLGRAIPSNISYYPLQQPRYQVIQGAPDYQSQGGTFSADNHSTTQWQHPDNTAYPLAPDTNALYGSQGTAPISPPNQPRYPMYSPTPDHSYVQQQPYNQDQHPRPMVPHTTYYNHAPHDPHGSRQLYYPANQQPIGLPGYPDPSVPNGPPSHNSHFYDSFPR